MSQRLRILVVLPMYGGSLPVGRSCVTALRGLGHQAEPFEAPSFFPSFEALKELKVAADKLSYLENSFLQVVTQAILAKVESFRPDLVLSLAQAPLSRQGLKRLKSMGVATAMWFVEDYRVFTYWRAFAPLYDVFAVIQREPFFTEMRELGVPHPLYLPLAADPAFHAPVELSPGETREFGAELSFMGAGYPNRRLAFRQLLSHGLKIWGSDWEGETLLAQAIQRGGARVTPEECVKIFNATKINLNLHSSVQAEPVVGEGDFVNPRTFELAACGAFQLVDRRQLLPELFAEDELATFGSMAELKERIEYFTAHPEERQAYAERGRARVLAEHTYGHRMAGLLDHCRQALPNWPPPREDGSALPESLDPELRQELARLLEALDLPADVAFADLVASLREREGVLAPLETAVLFLDEWKKQYGR